MNQEGLKSSICGKMKGKRGRRSLKELRQVDGHNREQQKIDQIFNNGKGKCLPEQVWRSLHGMLGVLMPLAERGY